MKSQYRMIYLRLFSVFCIICLSINSYCQVHFSHPYDWPSISINGDAIAFTAFNNSDKKELWHPYLFTGNTIFQLDKTIKGSPTAGSIIIRISPDASHVFFSEVVTHSMSGKRYESNLYSYTCKTQQLIQLNALTVKAHRRVMYSEGEIPILYSKNGSNYIAFDNVSTSNNYSHKKNMHNYITIENMDTDEIVWEHRFNSPVSIKAISANGNTIYYTMWKQKYSHEQLYCMNRKDYSILLISVFPHGNNESISVNDIESVAVSDDGNYVVFSYCANIMKRDTKYMNIYIRNMKRKITSQVSVAVNGKEANDESSGVSIRADGRYVYFLSNATNLVNFTNQMPPSDGGVYEYDVKTGKISLISVDLQGNSFIGDDKHNTLGRYTINRDGTIIVLVLNDGIYKLDRKSNTYIKLPELPISL